MKREVILWSFLEPGRWKMNSIKSFLDEEYMYALLG